MISTTAMGPSPPPRLIRVSMTLTRENSDIAPTANQFFDKDAPEDPTTLRCSTLSMSLEMLMRNTTTSAFNESLLPSHNLPGDSRILDRMYPAFFVQRDSPLNSNSRLSGMRSENQPQFEMSLRVPKQSSLSTRLQSLTSYE